MWPLRQPVVIFYNFVLLCSLQINLSWVELPIIQLECLLWSPGLKKLHATLLSWRSSNVCRYEVADESYFAISENRCINYRPAIRLAIFSTARYLFASWHFLISPLTLARCCLSNNTVHDFCCFRCVIRRSHHRLSDKLLNKLSVQRLHSVNTTCDSWTDSFVQQFAVAFTPCNWCTDSWTNCRT